jgi:succinylglutamate desuccinylase
MNYKQEINHYLEEFTNFEKKHPGPIPDSIQFNFNKHKGHIVFASIVHGNEVGSLPGLIEIIKQLSENILSYGGKVTFILGNKLAALQKIRFIEFDLNRSFGEKKEDSTTHERRRAIEIMQVLDSADVFFDFHQTNLASKHPFYIFSMHKESYYWAQACGVAPAFVTRKPGAQFSSAGMCSDEYMRSNNKAGITLELGEQGFKKEATIYTKIVTLRALRNMDKIFQYHSTIQKQAAKIKTFQFYTIIHQEPFNHDNKCLNDGLYNFISVKQNESIGFDENGNKLLCAKNGYILFPKYPNKNLKKQTTGELYVIVERLNIHPLNWLPKTRT